MLVTHPKVADVAVFGIPDDDLGEQVKAVVQTDRGRRGIDELARELTAYAREQLADFKVPESIDFEDELPRLPTGKLYKRILRDRYWARRARSSDSTRPNSGRDGTGSRQAYAVRARRSLSARFGIGPTTASDRRLGEHTSGDPPHVLERDRVVPAELLVERAHVPADRERAAEARHAAAGVLEAEDAASLRGSRGPPRARRR